MPPPDANLYPDATGLAADVVKAHAEEQPLKLYSGWFCPFVQRVWIVLEEKKIPYQYIEVNPYHKPESLLKLNPRGLVPTLEYENKPLYESTVLCEFLEDTYPTHEPRLLPADTYLRAKSRIWSDFVTSRILPAYHRFLQFQSRGTIEGEEELDGKRRELLGYLMQMTKEMDPEGPWFYGKEPLMVDFMIAPWAMRLWVFDHFKGGLGIPEEGKGGDDELVWARWRKWVNAVENRKSIKETMSDRQHYIPIYQKYADDIAQSEMAKASRLGRGVP